MSKTSKFIGLDVHKATITIAVACGGPGLKLEELGTVPHDVPRLVKRLLGLGLAEELHVAYEAGPTGYGLCRALRAAGISCIVVAPSKTPRRPGERVKTDRRDAAILARYLRAGELVAVADPDEETEALRDVVRAREDAVHALRRARQQLASFLLRHGHHWSGRSAWTRLHIEWIRGQHFGSEAQKQVLEDYVAEVLRATDRVKEWDEHVERWAEASPRTLPLYRALKALKGVSTIVAATLVAEIGDLRRFPTAPRLMSYLGLVPSERSSGPRVSRGSITKAGNPHVRWKLVQAAWQYRHRPAKTIVLERRSKGLPQEIRDIAWKAQKRLHHRYRSMNARGKRVQHTIVAIARELCGFIWAIGQVAQQPES